VEDSATPAANEAKAPSISVDWWAGVIPAAAMVKVAALRNRVADVIERDEEAQWLTSDGGLTLYRFLCARDMDVGAAEHMFRKSVQWRSANQIRKELAVWERNALSLLATSSKEPETSEEAIAHKYLYFSQCGDADEHESPLNVEFIGSVDVAGLLAVPGS
jgi:hypothetical protein